VNSTKTSESFSMLAAAQARFGQRVATRLSESTQTLAPEINERLRFAREDALQRVRAARTANAAIASPVASGSALLILGAWAGGWGVKLGSIAPLIALVAGLVLIQHTQTESQISAAAEIDADLLADDLPPRAYSDAGFVEYLKLPKD
jgi:fatty acid desaturase